MSRNGTGKTRWQFSGHKFIGYKEFPKEARPRSHLPPWPVARTQSHAISRLVHEWLQQKVVETLGSLACLQNGSRFPSWRSSFCQSCSRRAEECHLSSLAARLSLPPRTPGQRVQILGGHSRWAGAVAILPPSNTGAEPPTSQRSSCRRPPPEVGGRSRLKHGSLGCFPPIATPQRRGSPQNVAAP